MGLNPGHHTEAIKSRRSFLFMAAQVVESGRQRTLKLAVKAEWWQVLKGCYERLRTWLAAALHRLKDGGHRPVFTASRKVSAGQPHPSTAYAEKGFRRFEMRLVIPAFHPRSLRTSTASMPAARMACRPKIGVLVGAAEFRLHADAPRGFEKNVRRGLLVLHHFARHDGVEQMPDFQMFQHADR